MSACVSFNDIPLEITRGAAAEVAINGFLGAYSREALRSTVFPDAMTVGLIPN